MLQYLNIGPTKLKCSVELNIRFITGVKTFHVGDKMTFVINQREGLHNLCLKTKDSLLNVSEKLSLAFFWPKNPTDLVLVADLDLSNGTQHLASYPEEILDTDLETEDLIENVMPIYHDTPESKRVDIVKTINSKFNSKYAITKLYDTEAKAQASCAWKFDHWRQFDFVGSNRVEFCFKPVFKLDRINEFIHTNIGDDQHKYNVPRYSENPNRNYSYPQQSLGQAINYWQAGVTYQDTLTYRETVREEHFPSNWYVNGSVPTVDYYQVGEKFEWAWHLERIPKYREVHVSGCSHENGSTVMVADGYFDYWYVGSRDGNNPYEGSKTSTYKGKVYAGPGTMDIDDMIPGFRDKIANPQYKYFVYEIRNVSGYYNPNLEQLTFTRLISHDAGRVVRSSELLSSTLVLHRGKDVINIAKDVNGGTFESGYIGGNNTYYIINLTSPITAANLPEPKEVETQTLQGLPHFEIWKTYFTPKDIDPSEVNTGNIRSLASAGKISVIKEDKWTTVDGYYERFTDQTDGKDKLKIAGKYNGDAGFDFGTSNLEDIENSAALKASLDWFESTGIWKYYESDELNMFNSNEVPIKVNDKNVLFFDLNKSDTPYGIRFYNDLWEGKCLGNTTEMLNGWTYNDRLFIAGSYYGARSYCISSEYKTGGSAYIDFPAELYAGKSVRWSGYMAGCDDQDDRANTGLYALDQNKNVLASTGTSVDDEDWKSRALSISLPSNTYYIRVRLWHSNLDVNADAYWTNMTLTIPEDGTVARPSDGPFYVKDENYNITELSSLALR